MDITTLQDNIWEQLPNHVREPNPEIYLSNNYVVLDFETTTEENGSARCAANRILLSCYNYGSGHPNYSKGSRSIEGGEYDHSELVEDIMLSDYVVAHNAKFELQWLRRCGLDLRKVVSCCTQINEYVLSGNRRWGLSLGACAERRGLGEKDFIGALIRQGVSTEDIPRSMLINYCKKDVELTEKIWLHQRDHLQQREQLKTVYTRHLFTPVLADIEVTGMMLDEKVTMDIYNEYNSKFVELSVEFEQLTNGINFNSPPQVGQYLYDVLKFKELKDKKGHFIRNKKTYEASLDKIAEWELMDDEKKELVPKPLIKGRKTDADTLTTLEEQATTKEQLKFIELKKKLNKYKDALSKILNKFKTVIDEHHGMLFFNLNQTVTVTHRLASNGSNVAVQGQNINRAFKKCFKARYPKWKIVETDEAQLEFRSAVEQAQDLVGLKEIREGFDAHAQSASIMFPDTWVSKSETPAIRQESKAHTFKPLYGGKYGEDDAMRYYKFFREKYSGITVWQEDNFRQVFSKGYLRLPSGTLFFWPDTYYNNYGDLVMHGRNIQREICNYPVQSLCGADIVPIGVIYLWHLIDVFNMEALLVNTIHDSAIAEVPETEVEEFKEVSECCFTDVVKWYFREVYNYEFITPLEAESNSGDNWSVWDD